MYTGYIMITMYTRNPPDLDKKLLKVVFNFKLTRKDYMCISVNSLYTCYNILMIIYGYAPLGTLSPFDIWSLKRNAIGSGL